MKIRRLLFFVIILLASRFVYAQDVIVLKNGDRIESNILGFENGTIVYILQGDSVPVRLRISEALGVHYADSVTISFRDSLPSGLTPCPPVMDYEQGVVDANYNYATDNLKNKMRVTTLIITPLVGFIPTIVCASIRPSRKKFNFPCPDTAGNDNYNRGYANRAHRIKVHDAWAGYGKGTGQWFAAIGKALWFVVSLPFNEDGSPTGSESNSGSSSGSERNSSKGNQGNAARPSQGTSSPSPAPPSPSPTPPSPTLQPSKKPTGKQK